MNAYIFACNGIVNKNNSKKFLKLDDYYDIYQLLFEKAYSGYNLGKINESYKIYKDLLKNYPVNSFYKNIIEANLKIYPDKYNEKIISNNISITNKNKLDIILQGKYNDKVLFISEYYLQLDFINNIIISCWEDDKLPEIKDERIKIIKNKIPDNSGNGNRNYQVVSSLNGIKSSTTEYCIKIRNDQRYTIDSMKIMYEFYEKHKKKSTILL